MNITNRALETNIHPLQARPLASHLLGHMRTETTHETTVWTKTEATLATPAWTPAWTGSETHTEMLAWTGTKKMSEIMSQTAA